MKVTAKLLKRLGACAKQVKLFECLYPNGITWTTPVELQAVMNMAARKGFRVLWIAEKLKLTGLVYGYFPNGNLHFIVKMKKGQREGRMDQFYRKSTLTKITAHYRDGLLHGLYSEYDSKGELRIRQEYENGKLIPPANGELERKKG